MDLTSSLLCDTLRREMLIKKPSKGSFLRLLPTERPCRGIQRFLPSQLLLLTASPLRDSEAGILPLVHSVPHILPRTWTRVFLFNALSIFIAMGLVFPAVLTHKLDSIAQEARDTSPSSLQQDASSTRWWKLRHRACRPL